MSPIDRLPTELLLEIAALGGNPWDHYQEDGSYATDSKAREFLRNFCLVCKRWKDPGQEKLWEYVEIDETDRVDGPELLASSAANGRGLRTKSLCMNARIAEEIGLMVRSLIGMRVCSFNDVEEFDPEVLESDSLKELEELSMYGVYFLGQSHYIARFSPPFRLKQIRIEVSEHLAPTILAGLLLPSTIHASYDLDASYDIAYLDQDPDANFDRLLDILSSHAPNLQSLVLQSLPETVNFKTKVIGQFLTRCTGVTHLTCPTTLFDLFHHLDGIRLEKLSVMFVAGAEEQFQEVLDLWEGKMNCLKSLKELELNLRNLEGGEVETRMKGLRGLCEKRKIKFSWRKEELKVGCFLTGNYWNEC